MANKPVLCVETGEVFGRIKDAAAWLGKSPNAISLALRGLNPSAGGYHWEYVQQEEAAPKPTGPRGLPEMDIYEMQEEALRRSRETGRRVRYADLQKEETVALIRARDAREKLKRRGGNGQD